MSGSRSNDGVRVLRQLSLTVIIIVINIVFYTAVIYGIKLAANYSYAFGYRLFGEVSAEKAPGHDVKVTILKGESTMAIAQKLESSKIIVDRYSFYLKVKAKKYEIMPGTFVLNTSMSYKDILEVITDYNKSIDREQTIDDAGLAI